MSLFKNIPQDIDIEDGHLIYHESFFNYDEANLLYNILLKEINWKQDTIKMFGKSIPLPRETAWYGEKNASYLYSGIKNKPNKWLDSILKVKDEVESVCKISFNSVLANKYKDGNDKLSWHSDDEPELDKTSSIASLSFGSERDFLIKHKTKVNLKYNITLNHGSLLIMMPPMQEFWLHQIPKRANLKKERINLTFRKVKLDNE